MDFVGLLPAEGDRVLCGCTWGSWMCVGAWDGVVRVYELDRSLRVRLPVRVVLELRNEYAVHAMVQWGTLLCTAAGGPGIAYAGVRVWNPKGEQVAMLECSSFCSSLCVVGEGEQALLCSGHEDGIIRVWRNDECIARLDSSVVRHKMSVPGGMLSYVWNSIPSIRGAPKPPVTALHTVAAASSVACAPSVAHDLGGCVVAGYEDGTVQCWRVDAAGGESVAEWVYGLHPHTSKVECIATYGGRYVFTGSTFEPNVPVHVYDGKGAAVFKQLHHNSTRVKSGWRSVPLDGVLSCMVWGDVLYCGLRDCTVREWTIQSSPPPSDDEESGEASDRKKRSEPECKDECPRAEGTGETNGARHDDGDGATAQNGSGAPRSTDDSQADSEASKSGPAEESTSSGGDGDDFVEMYEDWVEETVCAKGDDGAELTPLYFVPGTLYDMSMEGSRMQFSSNVSHLVGCCSMNVWGSHLLCVSTFARRMRIWSHSDRRRERKRQLELEKERRDAAAVPTSQSDSALASGRLDLQGALPRSLSSVPARTPTATETLGTSVTVTATCPQLAPFPWFEEEAE